jgi:hypothetical protein
MDYSLYLAWLVAPTNEQRWEVDRQMFKACPPYEWVLYRLQQERTFFGVVELRLRRFWLFVAQYLPLWEWLRIRKRNHKLNQEIWLSLEFNLASRTRSENNR